VLYGGVFLVSAGATFLAALILLRLPGPVAQPVPDRWHRRPTPVTGGFALLAGLLVGLVAKGVDGGVPRAVTYVALGATAAFAVGFLDDRRRIGPRQKFAGQIAIAGATAAALHPHWLPLAVAIPVGALVLVASMNSFNFLDNIDGLAAGTAGIAAGALALTTLFAGGSPLRLLGCAGAGLCIGFLPFNYRVRRPAALFMGDAGSHLLGLVVGSAALMARPGEAGGVAVAVAAPLLILALPILDTSLVILVRLAEGRPIWRGGRDHISHRLVYVGLGERRAVAALLGLSAACAGVALAVVAADDALVTGAAVGLVLGLLVALGSRLALVTEEQLESSFALATDDGSDADAPLTRQPLMNADLEAAIVELRDDRTAQEAQGHARAN